MVDKAKVATRSRVTSASDEACKTCKGPVRARDPLFICITCSCKIHLTEKCTNLSATAIDGITELKTNVILLCNDCVEQNKRDEIISLIAKMEVSETNQSQITNIEKEMIELKNSLLEIKTAMIDKSDPPKTTQVNQPAVNQIRKTPEATMVPEGIRVRGIKESDDRDPRKRQEHDLAEIQQVFAHIEVNCNINDLLRLGPRNDTKTRTILVKVSNPWQRRLILSSASKLKTYDKPVYLSRELSREEATQENEALQKRRELINEKIDKKDLRIRDGKLLIRQDNKWVVYEDPKEAID